MHAHVSPCGTWIARDGHLILDFDAQIATDFKSNEIVAILITAILVAICTLYSTESKAILVAISLALWDFKSLPMWASKHLMKTSTLLENSILTFRKENLQTKRALVGGLLEIFTLA